MYLLKFTNLYKKNFKLIKKRGYDISFLNEVIIKLQNGIKLDKLIKVKVFF